MITDSNIEIIYSNQAIQTMFGRTDAQLRTMTFTDMMPKETAAETVALLQQFIRGTLDAGQVETDSFRSDGSTFNVHITASAVRDDSGELLFSISHWVDLTTNRHIAARLARSQATFESAFVDSPAGMSLRDKTFGAIRTNRAMREILGNPAHPSEGVFSVPEDDTDFWGSVQDIRDGRSSSFSRELKLTNSQGDTVWGLCTVSGIQTNGSHAGFLVHFVDVTGQRVARQRLTELAASKDALVRSVSHELRTPLTIIVGLASELTDRTNDFAAAERDEFIQMIANQATEMADLVEDLLSAAQSSVSEIQVDIVELDIVAVAKQVVDSLNIGAVSINAEPQPLAMGDAFRVRQIVRNLLVNATKYGKPPYEVAVTSEATMCICA